MRLLSPLRRLRHLFLGHLFLGEGAELGLGLLHVFVPKGQSPLALGLLEGLRLVVRAELELGRCDDSVVGRQPLSLRGHLDLAPQTP